MEIIKQEKAIGNEICNEIEKTLINLLKSKIGTDAEIVLDDFSEHDTLIIIVNGKKMFVKNYKTNYYDLFKFHGRVALEEYLKNIVNSIDLDKLNG